MAAMIVTRQERLWVQERLVPDIGATFVGSDP
jgi:hypothetical protein